MFDEKVSWLLCRYLMSIHNLDPNLDWIWPMARVLLAKTTVVVFGIFGKHQWPKKIPLEKVKSGPNLMFVVANLHHLNVKAPCPWISLSLQLSNVA